jgi:hypothetical protein
MLPATSGLGHQPPGATTNEGPILHPEQTPGPGCSAYLLRHGATVIGIAGWRRQSHLGPRHRSRVEALRAPCRSKPWSKSRQSAWRTELSQNAGRNCGLSGRRFRGVTLPRTAREAGRGGSRTAVPSGPVPSPIGKLFNFRRHIDRTGYSLARRAEVRSFDALWRKKRKVSCRLSGAHTSAQMIWQLTEIHDLCLLISDFTR